MKKENLLPNEFFITKGVGYDSLEKHGGCYHLALYDAGIESYNIMTYSSVLPANARLITLDEIDLPPHGAEMKCIQSVAYGEYGQHISAGIVYAWLYEDENFDKKYGGLVVEINGFYSIEVLEERLTLAISSLYERTYKDKGLYLGELNITTQGTDVPNDVRFGCCLVSLCFINYL